MNKVGKRLGTYLSKDIDKPIICEDSILKEQLENIKKELILNITEKEWTQDEYYKLQVNLQESISTLEKDVVDNFENILINFETKNWTLTEYNNFMFQLSYLDKNIFMKVYPILLLFISLPKEELQRKLEYYNEKLDLHIFDDKRELQRSKTIEIVNGREKIVPIEKYVCIKHKFEPKDLVYFVQTLDSKINSFSNVMIKEFQDEIDKCNLVRDKIVKIETILEELMKNNNDFINVISDAYHSMFNKLEKEDPVYLFLENQLNNIISQNKQNLRKKLSQYHTALEREHNMFLKSARSSYFSNKASKQLNKQTKKNYF